MVLSGEGSLGGSKGHESIASRVGHIRLAKLPTMFPRSVRPPWLARSLSMSMVLFTLLLLFPLAGDHLRLVGDFGNELERTPLVIEFDARGRFSADYTRAILEDAAFDGEQVLGRDTAGHVHELHGWQRDKALLMQGLVCGNWRGDLAPWKIEALPGAEGAQELELRLTEGARPFEARVWVDAESRRPRRATYETFGVEYELEFLSWRDGPGGSFPGEVALRSGGREVAAFRFTSQVAVEDGAPLTLVELLNPDAVFLQDAPRKLEVKMTSSGHTFVRVAIDDAEPAWFAFDTGASGTVLDDRIARELDLDPVAEGVTATGAGGSETFRAWRARELRVGCLRWRAPLLASTDLRPIGRAVGLELAGVLGGDVLSHGVWVHDIQAGELELHPPGELELPQVTWIPTRRDQGHLLIRALFEEHVGWFSVDTGGGGGGVVFSSPTTERLGLLEGRATTRHTLGGLGGSVSHRRGKIDTFEFGDRGWRDVPASFPEAIGTWRDPYVDGLIGIHFLRPFRVVFDYPGRRIGLISR